MTSRCVRGKRRDETGEVGRDRSRKGLLIPGESQLNSGSRVSPFLRKFLTSHTQPGGVGCPTSLFQQGSAYL